MSEFLFHIKILQIRANLALSIISLERNKRPSPLYPGFSGATPISRTLKKTEITHIRKMVCSGEKKALGLCPNIPIVG